MCDALLKCVAHILQASTHTHLCPFFDPKIWLPPTVAALFPYHLARRAPGEPLPYLPALNWSARDNHIL